MSGDVNLAEVAVIGGTGFCSFLDGSDMQQHTVETPYCPLLRDALASAAPDVKSGGTMVVVEGPRFSTRAESLGYAAQGWTLVNITGHPEAVLARELRMCYSALALVTDMDAGVDSGAGVSQAEVFALFKANLDRLTGLLGTAIGLLPSPDGCSCSTWADGIELTYEIP